MARFQKKTPVAAANGSDILSYFSAERRQQILDEALGTQVRQLVEQHQGGTFGALVEALRGAAHWDHIKNVNVSSVLRPSKGGAAPAPAPAKVKAAKAPAAKAPTAKAPAVAAAPKASGSAKRKGGRKPRYQPEMLNELVTLIQKNPGLRSEEIQKQVGGDKGAIKAALAKLRELKRVQTSGVKRSTIYTAA
ncbi:MAG: hypothetical protein EXR72_19895 [Myxococcales bacterium]|nr:hypothetical protein [Myxococcales bacterium]